MKSFFRFACVATTLLQVAAFAQTQRDFSSLRYKGPISTLPSRSAPRTIEVALKLQDPSLAEAVGANAKQNGIRMTEAEQRAYLAQLSRKQDALMSLVRSLGGVELGRVSLGHNALMVSIDSSQLQSLRAIQGVLAVRTLPNYKLAADFTLPYVGASTVQSYGNHRPGNSHRHAG